jgi:ribonuclease P protein component
VVTRDQHLLVRVARNQRRTEYRAAVIVSRKVHKSAVRRNRIRRRLYEIIRLQSPHITEPYDIVLTVFSDQLADMPAEKLTELVVGLLRKAAVVKAVPTPAVPDTHAIVTIKEDS